MDNVRQRVTVKLIPRIDLQAVANKLVMEHSFLLLLYSKYYYMHKRM